MERGEKIGRVKREIDNLESKLSEYGESEEDLKNNLTDLHDKWLEIVKDPENPTAEEVLAALDDPRGLMPFSQSLEDTIETQIETRSIIELSLGSAKKELSELQKGYKPDAFATGKPFVAQVFHGTPSSCPR